MHILFFTPAFPPFIGGGERYARSLALALAACGQQITVLTSHAQREQQLWQGTGDAPIAVDSDGPLTIIRCPLRPFPGGWRGLLAWRKAMVLLSALPGDQSALLQPMARRIPPLAELDAALMRLPAPPDLVHGFNLSWEHTLLVARDVAKRRGAPFVVTPFAHFGAGSHARVALNATMDHQRRLLSEASAVLALTSVESEGFARWNVHPQQVVVVGGGVDEPPPISDAAGVQASCDLHAPFALFVGRATADKGAMHAVQATLRLVQDGFPLTLAFAGRTAGDFQRFLARLDPAGRAHVHLLGTIDEQTKHALLQRTAMLLLPSQAESFGIVILEAWQHATPVVAARAGGISAVVDHGQNGLLAPFGDVPALAAAMKRLLTDRALSLALGRAGQDKVRREYTWQRVAERVLAVYKRVAG